MKYGKYILTKDFRSPLMQLPAGENQTYRFYQAGSEVTWYEYDNTDPSIILAPQLIIDGLYMIPLKLLQFVSEVTNPHPKNAGPEASKLPQDDNNNIPDVTKFTKSFQDELEKIRNTNIVHDVVTKSRNSVNGMLIGAGAGLVFSLITKKSMFGSIVLGSIAGGLIGSSIKFDFEKIKETNKPKDPSVPSSADNAATV